MPFQAVPNVAQIRCEGVVDGQQTINDLYFEISGGGINVVNLAAITNAVDSWFNGTLAGLLSDDWSTVRCTGVDLTTVSGPVFETSSVTPGGVSGEANPNNVAACISFRTGSRGRSFRGRNFVPAIPGSVVTLNTLDNGFITSLVAAYGALVGPGTFLAGWQWGVVSRRAAGALRPSGVITPVTGVLMTSNKVRSMRTREVGHGS